uniref:Uncharacterized protein n=1 Tax=Opuntia streptacantha TaxID=393608 RepID=A0A7C9DFL1_OPUST
MTYFPGLAQHHNIHTKITKHECITIKTYLTSPMKMLTAKKKIKLLQISQNILCFTRLPVVLQQSARGSFTYPTSGTRTLQSASRLKPKIEHPFRACAVTVPKIETLIFKILS